MHLCSFGHALALLGILFIRMHLCSFGHALALLGVLLYTHALMFILVMLSPGFGSVGSLALNACTYVR